MTSETRWLEPPEAWPEARRTSFNAMPEDQRRFMLDTFKGMEAAHTRRSQAISPTLDVANKWRPYLQSRQMTPDKALDYLVGAEYRLSTGTQDERQGMFLELAGTYGVDLTALAIAAEEAGESPVVDPATERVIQPLTDAVAGLAQRMDAREVAGVQDQQIVALTEFGEAKDEGGNALHPHFDELLDDMILLAKASQEAGVPPTLEEVYERASWSNPAVRERLLTARSVETRKAAGQQHANARREAVTTAKQTGTKVNGTNTAETQEQPRESVREELEFQARKAGWTI